MKKNVYEQLSNMTVVVADTGDIQAIRLFTPQDATTNPSLITAAASMPEYQDIVDQALLFSRKKAGKSSSVEKVVEYAIDRLSVEFGLRILKLIPGRVSTEVDARLSFDSEKTVQKARQIIKDYEYSGISKKRVLIKIASTWEGIRAAEILEKEGIHCNLTLLFGLHQAIACAEANATLISPFVGRILDWHKKKTGRDFFPAHEDPGVLSVTQIYNYYKQYGYQTEVMGASFRNIEEIMELAGCDLMTIAPKFLKELKETEQDIEKKLDSESWKSSPQEAVSMDKKTFDDMHQKDKTAFELLAKGIESFSDALRKLEGILIERLQIIEHE